MNRNAIQTKSHKVTPALILLLILIASSLLIPAVLELVYIFLRIEKGLPPFIHTVQQKS